MGADDDKRHQELMRLHRARQQGNSPHNDFMDGRASSSPTRIESHSGRPRVVTFTMDVPTLGKIVLHTYWDQSSPSWPYPEVISCKLTG